jgi:hypothetical protein
LGRQSVGFLDEPHPEEAAISAFTRVFDALWRPSRRRRRGCLTIASEGKAAWRTASARAAVNGLNTSRKLVLTEGPTALTLEESGKATLEAR